MDTKIGIVGIVMLGLLISIVGIGIISGMSSLQIQIDSMSTRITNLENNRGSATGSLQTQIDSLSTRVTNLENSHVANIQGNVQGTYYISTNAVYGPYSTDISCDPGDQVISGGGDAGLTAGWPTITSGGPGILRESRPLSSNTWRVGTISLNTGQSVATQSPSALCLKK